MAQEQFVGLDVSQAETSVCVVDEARKMVWQGVRTGGYREVAVKSERSHRTRGLLTARAKLVGMRKQVVNQIRGLLKVFGHLIEAAGGEKFDARARELAAGDTTLTITTEALPAVRAALAA